MVYLLHLDLHVHTEFSIDGYSSLETILQHAQNIGLDGLAITDHDAIEGALEAERIAADKDMDLVIVPGIEVSTAQGHLIVLGVRETIPKDLSIEETIRIARGMNGVIVASHPFHPFRHSLGNVSGLDLDAVEVFNSRYITGFSNRRAEKIAKKNGWSLVAGSDAHVVDMVGYGVTFVDAEKDVGSVLQAIVDGRTSTGGRMTPLGSFALQFGRGFMRRMRER